MHFRSLFWLSTASLALGHSYNAPASLLARAAADCSLPSQYIISDFTAKSNDTGNSIQEYKFNFEDETSKVTTLCQFNASSESTTPSGLEPRYPCEKGDVKFIWQAEQDKLWMIERVCPTASG